VFSQGETLEELEENIRDAYRLVLEDEGVPLPATTQRREIRMPV
jgi:predicted RNase H-like HicB family nuclease